MRALLLLLLLVACSSVHPPPAPPRQTHLGIQMTQVELANGLRVVLVLDPKATEVQVTMRYRVGAADDPPDRPGTAHLVEHLMFQQVLGSQSLFATLESVATSFNAGTSQDSTTYFARAPVEQLERLLSIEAVRLGFRCTSITDSAFEREREVVANEARLRDEDSALRAIYRALYPEGHPYRHVIGGTPDTVRTITREQACSFADAHYAPGNAVLVISGDLTATRVDAALGKFLARIPSRTVAPRTPVARLDFASRRIETKAQVDEPVVVLTWPLPTQPAAQSRLRTIAPFAAAVVNDHVKGRVTTLTLGDDRAPLLGIAIVPGTGESVDDVIRNARKAIDDVPSRLGKVATAFLGDVVFDRMRQTALYGLFENLEDGSGRDAQLAARVLDGESLGTVAGELAAVGKMTQVEAVGAAKDSLGFERAAIVIVRPQTAAVSLGKVELAPPIHDRGLHRDLLDPADAHRPAPAGRAPRGFAAVRQRVLPNGLKVVLLPSISIPTVELRLVFGAGSADEPADRRGIAYVAAHGLNWRPRYINDLIRFAAAGGSDDASVDFDATTFIARGLDMHIDILIAGLRRWVLEGYYDNPAITIAAALRQDVKARGELAGLSDAWRAAVYGIEHPYTRAGVASHFDQRITLADVERFRDTHYTPDNATLVVAGGFDPDLADRWIDFAFHDWSGKAAPRDEQRAQLRPQTLASDEKSSQVYVGIAIPAGAKRRAHQLVEAELLAIIAGDVRHQLGATYNLAAGLDESRLATNYVITGAVQLGRVREVVELLKTRLAELRSDPDAAARAFVAARSRVAARLAAITGSAHGLAWRISNDAAAGRAPMSDGATADEVRRLTIDSLSLVDLDLDAAAIVMRGPASELEAGFAALGRTPTLIKPTAPVQPPTETPPHFDNVFHETLVEGFEDPLTEQPPAKSFELAVEAGYGLGRILDHGTTGVTFGVAGAYRLNRTIGVGLHGSITRLAGDYTANVGQTEQPGAIDGLAGRVQAFIERSEKRARGSLYVGLQFDRFTDNNPVGRTTTTSGGASVALGAELGIDLLHRNHKRIGLVVRGDSALFSESNWAGLMVGLFIRR